MMVIEKNIIDKLSGDGVEGEKISIQFKAYEETIEKLEYEIDVL